MSATKAPSKYAPRSASREGGAGCWQKGQSPSFFWKNGRPCLTQSLAPSFSIIAAMSTSLLPTTTFGRVGFDSRARRPALEGEAKSASDAGAVPNTVSALDSMSAKVGRAPALAALASSSRILRLNFALSLR